jgi:hypothetical protein
MARQSRWFLNGKDIANRSVDFVEGCRLDEPLQHRDVRAVRCIQCVALWENLA